MKSPKEKMLAGELYSAEDSDLYTAHLHAQSLLTRFNATPADARDKRRALLIDLFARFGKGTILKPML